MHRLTLRPGNAKGAVAAPPSKSVTHRAIYLSHLAGSGMVEQPLLAADTLATVGAVKALGSRVVCTPTEVTLQRGAFQAGEVDAQNSGTTIRLGTAIAALGAGTSRLTGDESLLQRPVGPLVESLNQLGVTARCTADGTPPVEVTGPLEGGTCQVDASGSSQYLSALLMAGTQAEQDVYLEVEGLVSRPYVDMTLEMIREAGGRVRVHKDRYHVIPGLGVSVDFQIPGDYSGAAFPLVAGALTGEVTVTGLPDRSQQADERILDLLKLAGADVKRTPDSVTAATADLQGFTADLQDCPDLFPILCVLATQCEGTTTLTGAPHLRKKESDRIEATVDLLSTLGATIKGTEDGAIIEGGTALKGGEVRSHGDHRIQMAGLIAGTVAEGPVTVDGGDAHSVSYPTFPQALRDLGLELEVQDA